MFEYDKLASEAVKVLDRCDFSEEIEYCKRSKVREADEVREYIGRNYLWEVREALDNLALDEFVEYLTARYNIRWQEVSYYEMY